MKIIKSFFVIIVCLCATTILHAQQAVNETAGPAKAVPAAVAKKSSPVAEFKPQGGVKPTVATTTIAEAPSPFNKKEDALPVELPKTVLVQDDNNNGATRTANRVAEKEKSVILMPNSIDKSLSPKPVTKPAAKTQQ